jgi:hypothetical protein
MDLSFRINSKSEEANTGTTKPWECKLFLEKFKKKVNLSRQQAVEAHRFVRRRGSHISSQSANRWR